MNPEVRQIEEKNIIGMSIRTMNERESNPETASIPGLWKNFFEYNVMAQIPKVLDKSVVYGVYSDYESDALGEYKLLVGLQSDEIIKPNNLDMVGIEAGDYLVFKVTEASPVGIMDTWANIETYFNDDTTTYKRAYKSDFEIYQGSNDISIHIGIL